MAAQAESRSHLRSVRFVLYYLHKFAPVPSDFRSRKRPDMTDASLELLSPDHARQLVELAEQARRQLERFAEGPVRYDGTGLQLLDEWIERTPSPPRPLQILWVAFLGEVFRRRHNGAWAVHRNDSQQLVVVCPTEKGTLHPVEVAAQLSRRIARGIAESLALFYVRESILLREHEDIA